MNRLFSFAKFILIAGIINAVTLSPLTAAPAAPAASENTLIAAFLYNFLKFTEWPEGTIKTELVLCTSKSLTFEELDAISGRSVQSKPVRIKRISFHESTNECQLLFLPREDSAEQIREWLKIVDQRPILIVSNIRDFLDMGGMITLINDGKNLNFEVDLERVKYAGLRLNAQLLQIARGVRGR